MSRVLVAEDDVAILRGIADNLAFERHEVVTASDGATAYRLAREARPDVIVLDLVLPGISGYDVCRRLRAEGVTTPIIMVTARGEEADRILGLDIGADDYMTKPFAIRELLARVRAMLRRARASAAAPDVLAFDDVMVDFRGHEVRRAGRPVDVTRKEMALLRYFAAHPGEALRRDQMLEEVWGYAADVTTRTVDNHVALLRAKLEQDPRHPRHIATVHGIGYKWLP
ncbi:MAG: response regulator transcription factor [Gemmatimonadota bacterium]|nr:response regulator transcription factor [Gemmatimonadota bacterium]